MRQLSEAQDLKEHVDRREQVVSRVLARCLSPEQHRDYRYHVLTGTSKTCKNMLNLTDLSLLFSVIATL